jgi:hypothetical protein
LATVNIGNLTFTHKGDYDGSTAYVKNDVVYYATNGNAYIAKQGTTGNVPTNATYWSQFAQGSGGIWSGGLSLGTANQVVAVNASANALEFQNASSGDCVKIATANAAGAADIYMDNVFTNTYKYYRLVYGGIKFSAHANGAWLRIGFRTGGASGTNHGGTYYNKYHEIYNGESAYTLGGGNVQNDSTGVQVTNTWNQQTDGSPSSTSSNTTYAPYRQGGHCDFFYPTQDNYKPSFIFHNQWNDNGHIGYSIGVGYNNSKITTGGITGLRINCESHNIATGFFTLYGFKL